MYSEKEDDSPLVYFSLTIPEVKSDKTMILLNLAREIGVPFDVSYSEPINYEEETKGENR